MSESSDVARRLSLGVGSQAYGQLVLVVIRLGEVPLFLHYWGAQLYGEWLMLAAIPTYFALTDGGFAGAASREMSMRSGAGDNPAALSAFQSTAVLLGLVSLLMIGTTFFLTRFLPLGVWLGFHEIGTSEVAAVLLLLIVHVALGFQGGLINGGFWCSGKYPMGMALATSTQLIEFVALAATVAMGGGPVQAAWAYLGGRLVGTLVMGLALRRATPWLRYGRARASLGTIRRLASPAFASLAFPVGNAMNLEGMRIVVGVVLGPAAVAAFVPLRTLGNFAAQPRTVVNRLIEPELSLAFGRGDAQLFGRLLLRGCQVAIWFCAILICALLLFGPLIWPIWTRGAVTMHMPLFLLILAATLVNSVWYTALMVPYATNRHQRVAVLYTIVYGVGALAGAYACVARLGLSGVGVALVVAESVMAILAVPTALRLSQQRWGAWLSAILRPPTFILSHASASRVVPRPAPNDLVRRDLEK